MSVTHDEYWHLPVGLLSWRTGRFDFDPLNPPLARMWAAVPLLAGAATPTEPRVHDDAMLYGDEFLHANRARFVEWYRRGRRMTIALSLLTTLLLALWTRSLIGPVAGLTAALLWALDPSPLAHAALVTTDVAAALAFLLVVMAAQRFARRASWPAAVVLGGVLGLAQLVKFTCLLLYPLSVVIWFVVRRGADVPPLAIRKTLTRWVAALSLSLVVLNAGYLGRGSLQRLQQYDFESRALQALTGPLSDWPILVPLPRAYVQGVDRQRHIMESPHPVYLDTYWREGSFPDYYLRVLAYKLPHPAQALLLLALLCVLRPRGVSRNGRLQLLLLLPPLLLLAIASNSNMQLGIRYILPALPFLYAFASQAVRWCRWRVSRLRTLAVALCLLAVPLGLRHHPEQLAYFNELSGGPDFGRWRLLDSNLDWGQDLRALREYLEQRPIPNLHLGYFGTVPPGEFGLEYVPPPSYATPGWYAVSVNFVQGRPHWLRRADGSRQPVDADEFAYLRDFRPVTTIGRSIDIYHLTEEGILWNAARWMREHDNESSLE